MSTALNVKKGAGLGYKTYGFVSDKNTSEFYIAVEAPYTNDKSFSFQLKALSARYLSALKASGLAAGAASYIAVFTKSDKSDKEILSLLHLTNAPVTVIRQASLSKAGVSLIAYCVKLPPGSHGRKISYRVAGTKNSCYITRLKNYSYLWSLNLNDLRKNSCFDAFLQTSYIFRQLQEDLRKNKATLANNLLRTWVYVDDLYANYMKMTRSRAKVFSEEKLTSASHFVASTGIGGKIGNAPGTTVSLNALSVIGIKKDQVTYLRPQNAMCPAYKYNVTFERGSKISYGDRAHILISGTASINRLGDVVFANDISKQTNHALYNIKAVLKSGNGSLKDLTFLIIYVKYAKDATKVRKIVNGLFPDTPCVFLRAPICRKEWLVEIEGVAILRENNRKFLPF